MIRWRAVMRFGGFWLRGSGKDAPRVRSAVVVLLVFAAGLVWTGAASATEKPENIKKPEITGSAEVGQLLTATTGTWKGTGIEYTYQWYKCNNKGAECTHEIEHATAPTYRIINEDLGVGLIVRVFATIGTQKSHSDSNATEDVKEGPPVNGGPPVITGSPREGDPPLSATEGTWYGSPVIKYTYQWEACGETIDNATGSSYELTNRKVLGCPIRVRVTASNKAGEKSSTSAETTPAEFKPQDESLPVLSGTPEEEQTLKTTSGTWTGYPTPSFAYKWKCASECLYESLGNELILTEEYVGHRVESVVTASNFGEPVEADSLASEPIEAGKITNVEPPTISSSGPLTNEIVKVVSNGTWKGQKVERYEYQWEECGELFHEHGCAPIPGATQSSLQVEERSVHNTLQLKVTAVGKTHKSAAILSNHSGTVEESVPKYPEGWGQDEQTELGTGWKIAAEEPVASYDLRPWVITHVYAGAETSYALTNHGELLVWATGGDGELGTGNGESAEEEANRIKEEEEGIVESEEHEERDWPEPVPLPSPVKEFDAGSTFAIARLENGKVYEWGKLNMGSPKYLVPTVVTLENGEELQGKVENVYSRGQDAAVKTEDHIYEWGANSQGQVCGLIPEKSKKVNLVEEKPYIATLPPGVTAKEIKEVSLANITIPNGGLTMYLTDSGEVYTCGSDSGGQLGVSSPKPYEPNLVSLDGSAKEISAGYFTGGAVLSNGHAYVWGDDEEEQLGQREPDATCTKEGCTYNPEHECEEYADQGYVCTKLPVELPVEGEVTKLQMTKGVGFAIVNGEEVYEWGNDLQNRLGVDPPGLKPVWVTGPKVKGARTEEEIKAVPTPDHYVNAGKVTQLDAGGFYVLALRDGTMPSQISSLKITGKEPEIKVEVKWTWPGKTQVFVKSMEKIKKHRAKNGEQLFQTVESEQYKSLITEFRPEECYGEHEENKKWKCEDIVPVYEPPKEGGHGKWEGEEPKLYEDKPYFIPFENEKRYRVKLRCNPKVEECGATYKEIQWNFTPGRTPEEVKE
jgi:alpha-tubulin suppressor-like RCC1 family protein